MPGMRITNGNPCNSLEDERYIQCCVTTRYENGIVCFRKGLMWVARGIQTKEKVEMKHTKF